MTRDEAVRQLQTFLAAFGLQSPGLNAQDLGGASLNGAQVYFQFVPPRQALRVSALVHRFRTRPRAEVLDAFRAEGKAGTDAGGGAVDYDAESRCVFLTRAYAAATPAAAFQAEVEALLAAAERWRREVVPKVAERAFKNDLR